MGLFGRYYWQGLALLAGTLLVGCSRGPEVSTVGADSARAERRPIVDVRREDGRLQAWRSYSFVPAVGALKLRTMHVQEGDLVAKGQKLFSFQTDTLLDRIAILTLQTNALASKIETEQFQADVERPVEAEMALIAAQTAHEDAVRAAETCAQMAQGGLAAQTELDKALRAKARTALSLRLAKQRHARAVSGVSATGIADLQVERKRCVRDLNRLREQLAACEGTAPFAGRILSVNRAVKDYGKDLAEGQLIFTPGRGPLLILADTSKMRLLANLFETAVAFIKPGLRAEVVAEHAPGQTFKGTVAAVGQLGYAHGQSSTLSVEVMVDNSKGLLKPGLTAEVSIIVSEREDVLAIPSRFLRCSDAGYYVWQRRGQEIVQAAVEVGTADRDFVEVVSGLKSGDEVIME